MLLAGVVLLLSILAKGDGSPVLDAVKGALGYYQRYPAPLSSGLLFGIILLEGQLYGTNFEDKETQHEVHHMIKICDDILENNSRPWFNLQMVKRIAHGLAGLKQTRQHSVGKPHKLEYLLEDSLLSSRPSPQQSTYCILEAMEGHRISPRCLLQETDPEATGYSLSHQAIYFMLATAMKLNPKLTEHILAKLCNKILSEVNYSWEKGMPKELTDLFIEEVAVCGLGNFKEFLTESISNFIIALQQEEGCFSTSSIDEFDRCEDHLSAVSMVALGNFLHFQNNYVNEN